MIRPVRATFLALALLVGASAVPAGAATSSGWLDRTFAGRGYLVVPTVSATRYVEALPAGSAVRAPSGRIYVATTRYPKQPFPAGQQRLTWIWVELTAYTASGHIDTAFNGGRPLVVSNGWDDVDNCCVTFGPWVTASGGVEVALLSHSGATVIRYTSAGQRDLTYSGGGKSTLASQDPFGAFRVVRLPGGSIRMVENTEGGTSVLSGLTAAGAIDTAIGTDGRLTLDGSYVDGLTSDPLGRLYVVREDPDADTLAVTRLSSPGVVDATWGTAGTGTVSVPGLVHRFGSPVTLGPGDEVYLAASLRVGDVGPVRPALVKLTASGDPDAAFGTAGVSVLATPHTGGSVEALTVDAAGRLLVSFVDRPGPKPYLTRLDAVTGARDTTFGSAGLVPLSGMVTDLEAASDGTFLTVGRVTVNHYSRVILARRNG
ncbi:MAG: NHL repeat-containing protein [Candidatus Limnocylindrales bacterium]